RRFLNYTPGAKWTALAAAIATGILYVALLVVFGLFVDLVISRGTVASFRSLSADEQDQLLEDWAARTTEDRLAFLEPMQLNQKRAGDLATADGPALTPRDHEIIWRCHIFHLIERGVTPQAAERAVDQPLNQDLTDRGILSLVVRSQNRVYGPLIG